MMHVVLFVLTRRSSQKSKLVPVARLIYVSTYNSSLRATRLSLSELRIVISVLQKRNYFASTHRSNHYRNIIHASSRCMDSVQPRTPSVWMECILASHNLNAERTRKVKCGDITNHDMFILNRTCHPSHDLHTESTHIKHMSIEPRR
jgi:hypothetical protein